MTATKREDFDRKMSAEDFVLKCESLGIRLLALEGPDGEDKIHLRASDKSAVTERIILFLKAKKLEVLMYLHERTWRPDSDGEEDDTAAYADDPAYGDAIRTAYAAALAGDMSGERAQLCPGTSTEDAGKWFVGAVKRARRLREGYPSCISFDEYMSRTTNERVGIEAVAAWWAEKRPAVILSAPGGKF